MDFVGAIVELYTFDAYGNAIGFDPSVALTEFLYSGEQFDSKIGQQYLRARYYDPVTGRFNRLDPFFGNLDDPQSLHKYLYTHADPVNAVDPSGKFVAIAVGLLGGVGLSIGMNVNKSSKDLATGALILRGLATVGAGIAGYFGSYAAYGLYGDLQGFEPIWKYSHIHATNRPHNFANLSKSTWEENIYITLREYMIRINNTEGNINIAQADIEAKTIAKRYVEIAWNKAKEIGILTTEFENNNLVYGRSTSNTFTAWIRNMIDKRAHCATWADAVFLGLPTSQHWILTAYYDYVPMGDPSLGFFMHSFVGISLKGQKTELVLDPWASGYPHIFEANDYFAYHGKGLTGWENSK
jgi:RHS repeat-associated protein